MQYITIKSLDEKQNQALNEILPYIPSLDASLLDKVSFEKSESFSLAKKEGNVVISYAKEHQIYRALSLLSGFVNSDADVLDQKKGYGLLCYMADMSRNAVYNMPSAKRMIRYLAMMGYDSLMLYTEDTFELPGYPYFGHMRGAFSKEELKEIDDYAFMFGIEVIPCIQTLAHLSTAIRWPGLAQFSDTPDILLVGHEKTYKFIKDMFEYCKEVFRSRRINIGMDEAHMLGRGNYTDKFGYEPKPDIMIKHLDKVVEIADEVGLAPMIWSDMFFRMAFNGAYRVREGEIAQDIIDRVPEKLTLIYWDYYSLDKQIFTHMVDCHLKFKNPIMFAGGAWKWYGFAPHNKFSLVSTELQLDVCEEKGLDNVIVTAWGDNGGECSQFSVLPSMLYYAERAYAADASEATLDVRCNECFGIGFDALMTMDDPNNLEGVGIQLGNPVNPSRYQLFNDPLEGLMDVHGNPESDPVYYAKAAEKLASLTDNKDFGYIFDTLAKLCVVLKSKCNLSIRIREAYKAGDKVTLSAIANEEIPALAIKLDNFLAAFRKQWYKENKTFGFGTQEIRIGGLRARLVSTADRLNAYLNGDIDVIEELEKPVLSFNGRQYKEGEVTYTRQMRWNENAAVGIL
ncbi:MAG: family 20 glycosylhydrolase [Clostridia bacterium]|nr:family 20 glycosylhydrolase [Clostridia bacterium]